MERKIRHSGAACLPAFVIFSVTAGHPGRSTIDRDLIVFFSVPLTQCGRTRIRKLLRPSRVQEVVQGTPRNFAVRLTPAVCAEEDLRLKGDIDGGGCSRWPRQSLASHVVTVGNLVRSSVLRASCKVMVAVERRAILTPLE